MKLKLFLLASSLTFAVLPIAAHAVEPCDIRFTQEQDGKYIYCNNHEKIRKTDLADDSNQYAKYIMNNEGLTPDRYNMFLSFLNRTDSSADSWIAADRGFDIELDVMFKAQTDTTITIERLGFEVPEHHDIFLNGTEYATEDEWGCFTCWATYMQAPIKEINSGNVYEPINFEEVTVDIPAGETVWLSDYIPNYREVPFCRSVNIMSDFTIDKGTCDVNVAAFRSTGTLGDRSRMASDPAFGSYYRDKQYKGISDGSNEVTAKITYTIDDSDTQGNLPVTVYNHYAPDGNTLDFWYTHLNPRADLWSYDKCAESDMISLKYYDPQKRTLYGKNIDDEDKDDYYYFDVSHVDTSTYEKSYGKESDYIPNREITDDDPTDIACNIANYGVIYNYEIEITNNGYKQRYLTYRLATSSNNIVYLKDESGNIVDNTIYSKGTKETRISDNMACMTIPAMTTSKYTLCVVLTPNYPGGMENYLYLSDYPQLIETYETERSGILKDRYFTGREYYKWDNYKLYMSDDRQNWREISLPQSVFNSINGSLNQYSITFTGSGYIMRPTLYDAGSYSHASDLYRDMYLFDENFNLVTKTTLGGYPQDASCANGVYYVKTSGSVFKSAEFKWWELVRESLPCWNYGVFSAVTDNGTIKLSTDGITFEPVLYNGFKPDYIDSYGDLYYCADGRALYLSKNGIYWNRLIFSNKVSSFEIDGNSVIVNGDEKQELPEFFTDIYVKISGNYIAPEKTPILNNGTTYFPIRTLAEELGCDVEWNDGVISITSGSASLTLTENDDIILTDGTSYAPVRAIAEYFGYTVSYDESTKIAEIE